MINWDQRLIDSVARRRAVLVVGSGVSRNSVNADGVRPLSWDGFLRTCCAERGDPPYLLEVIQRRDYLLGSQLLKRGMGADAFIERVQVEFQRKGFRAADIHKNLYQLDVPITLSPNFDNIYDDYCRAASDGSYVIKTHTSSDIASYLNDGGVRLLIKSHGAANDPQDLIFTAEEYSRARTKYQLFYDIIRSLALTHTFFFVGCGVDDPDIKMLFEDIKFTYGRTPSHYMTTPEGEVSEEILTEYEHVMPIKYVRYDPSNGHQALTSSLEALVALVEERREQLSESLGW